MGGDYFAAAPHRASCPGITPIRGPSQRNGPACPDAASALLANMRWPMTKQLLGTEKHHYALQMQRSILKLVLDIACFVAASAAAWFWFLSAKVKYPPMLTGLSPMEGMVAVYTEPLCQSARKKDPLSASKRDPFRCDLCAAMDVSLFG
jgi:hypothetical protein